jgi:hypothetical protein
MSDAGIDASYDGNVESGVRLDATPFDGNLPDVAPTSCADIGQYPGEAACCDAAYCAGTCNAAVYDGKCYCNDVIGGCGWPTICCLRPLGCVSPTACESW